MAYDKVVDSSVLDAGLKQIANAIREKAGTSDNLAFPQAMAEAIAAIEAGGGATLWNGGKFTMGSFVLAEETTEYIIATSSDDAIVGLLNDGETMASAYESIGLLVVAKTSLNLSSLTSAEKQKRLHSCVRVPVYYGSGSFSFPYYGYWDNYGGVTAKNGSVANVTYTNMSIKSTAYASPLVGHEYLWLAWRCIQ